jgi:polysaccharide pyruvyl transferase WcaK-like protein
MRRTLKILHLASFVGNVGDTVNHLGFRHWFEALLDNQHVTWTNLEIREFYWKNKSWDDDLIALINTYDLLVVGGGNYLELWVKDSPSGTSIGFTMDQLQAIDVPVFFNALGFDTHQGVYGDNAGNAKNLLSYLTHDPKRMITVRNDGAKKNLTELYGSDFSDLIPMCPDGGFFVDLDSVVVTGNSVQDSEETVIAINLACDMEDVRFKNYSDGSSRGFIEELAAALTAVSRKNDNLKFVFISHVFSDLWSTFQVLKLLPDKVRRKNVRVSAYDRADSSVVDIINEYRNADLVLASRFHSNVLALALNKLVIPLVNYPQISNLYADVDLSDLAFDVSLPGFEVALGNLIGCKVDATQLDYDAHVLNAGLLESRLAVEAACKKWLTDNNIIGIR